MADWKSELGEFFEEKETKEAETNRRLTQLKSEVPGFMKTVVLPAFHELKEQLEKRDRKVSVHGGEESASIRVEFNEVMELHYSIEIQFWPSHAHPHVVTKMREGGQTLRGESFIKRGSADSIDNITKEDIAEDFLRLYKGQVGRGS